MKGFTENHNEALAYERICAGWPISVRGFSQWRDLRSSTGASKRWNFSRNLHRALHWL